MGQSFEFEITRLQKLAPFRGAGRDALNALAFNADRVVFARGESVFTQGEEGHDAWLILAGEAQIIAREADGRSHAAPVYAGMMAGESALFDKAKRRSTLIAESELHALRIQRSTFLRAVSAYPDLARSVRRALRERLAFSAQALRQPRPTE
jgi:CRP-like cAMP-binding protein